MDDGLATDLFGPFRLSESDQVSSRSGVGNVKVFRIESAVGRNALLAMAFSDETLAMCTFGGLPNIRSLQTSQRPGPKAPNKRFLARQWPVDGLRPSCTSGWIRMYQPLQSRLKQVMELTPRKVLPLSPFCSNPFF